MAQAKRDENRIATLLGVSSADSLTPVVIEANPTTKAIFVELQGSTVVNGGAIIGPEDPVVDSYQSVAINLDAGANQVLASSAANKQIWVYSIGFTLSVAGTVSFQDEDDTAITGIMSFAANSGLAPKPSGNFAMPMWKLATNKDLEVDIVTASVDGWISYAIVSV